ncbi:GerMN domain-containing protein [Chamaesiphon minutus]|uniref:Sporulation/spore germination protein n=1 Tax=Chamaesiphon minutus (strain ATCC 27169 / PCC 6605) TaxID=1173020 RepID=K9UN50_CHAP6|nr:GerMN domain-containing protein [Chamaesiphon minutus]AFY96532.1 sporulation/spore germination protein [Chamaesiphon minutus PCC 6605]
MKITVNHKHAVKLSLLLTTVVALSLWAGNLVLSPDRQKPSTPVTTSSNTPTNPPPRSTTQLSQPQVYWLRTSRNKLTLVAKSLPSNTDNNSSSSSQQVLTTAMHKLLAAQPGEDLSSTIPKGTKLRSLKVRADGVHVDLSREFRSGGGSTSVIYRIAQVIYTATSLNPDGKVFVSIEGQPIDEKHPLGGEGLILHQPTTRAQFLTDFPLDSRQRSRPRRNPIYIAAADIFYHISIWG